MSDYEFPGDRQSIVAIATFNTKGLPIEYNVVDANISLNWTQTVFQTISLQLLLQSNLGLEGFSRAVIPSDELYVLVVQQPNGYRATVFRCTPPIS